MMTESEMANGIIEERRQSNITEVLTADLEVHYNVYGTRGVLDLVMVLEDPDTGEVVVECAELKSEHAVKEAGGANKIIKQFNRHQNHFREGSTNSYPMHGNTVRWVLWFRGTDSVWGHIRDNRQMYETVHKEGVIVRIWEGGVKYQPLDVLDHRDNDEQ